MFPLDIHPEVGLLAGEVALGFNFLISLHTVFYNGCTRLPSCRSSDGASRKEPACRCRRHEILEFQLWVGKTHWRRRARQPTAVFFFLNNFLYLFLSVCSLSGAGFLRLRQAGLLSSRGGGSSPSGTALGCRGFSTCGPWAPQLRPRGSRAQAQ